MSVTFITVVFELEVPLLRLQAMSFERFVPADAVAEIVVVDNTRRGLSVRERQDLEAAYGRHRARVVTQSAIGSVPGAPGWERQQVLKLLVSELVATDRYIALDAKNHFVRRFDDAYFRAPDGRARIGVHGYETHPLRESLLRTVRYLGADEQEALAQFPATVTPFVLLTAESRALVEEVQRRSGRPFAAEFLAHGLTEFFLYSAWMQQLPGGRSARYADGQPGCPVVWPGDRSARAVRAAVDESDATGTPMFSVHRTALARMDDEASDVLVRFWCRIGLLRDPAEALAFVESFRRTFRRRLLARRAREAPYRALRRIRRHVPARVGGRA